MTAIQHKTIKTMISSLFLLAASLNTAHADYPSCSSGNVISTGSGQVSGGIFFSTRTVQVTCDDDVSSAGGTWPKGQARTFRISPTDRDAIYAAALTALTNGNKVRYSLNNSVAENTYIVRFEITNVAISPSP
jgi:hypothetical protein